MPHLYLTSCLHIAGALFTDALGLLPGTRRAGPAQRRDTVCRGFRGLL